MRLISARDPQRSRRSSSETPGNVRSRFRAGLLLALVIAVLCACSTDKFRTERRALWQGTIDGVDVAVRVELHGWHVAAHTGPEFHWIAARDFYAIYEVVETTRAGAAVARRDAGELPVVIAPAPTGRAAGLAALAALSSRFCPIASGLVYRVGSRGWTALWRVGDAVFRSPLDLTGDRCEDVIAHVPPAWVWLAAHPLGATTCRALDDAGHREMLVDCKLAAFDGDLAPPPIVPAEGPMPLVGSPVVSVDRDVVDARIAHDPALLARLEDRLLRSPPALDDTAAVGAAIRPIDLAGQRAALVMRLATQCRDVAQPCSDAALRLADLAIRWGGGGRVTPEGCGAVVDLAMAVRARGGDNALRSAFQTISGSFQCDRPAGLRALALAGLATATSEDVALTSPDAIAYAGVDNDCQPSTSSGRPDVSGLCRSFPRWAGSWLGAHCGADAVERARAVAAARPRAPFDPREDQVLDGALRVLGACNARAFEAAIAHMPETTTSMADIRSREHLRAVFRR